MGKIKYELPKFKNVTIYRKHTYIRKVFFALLHRISDGHLFFSFPLLISFRTSDQISNAYFFPLKVVA